MVAITTTTTTNELALEKALLMPLPGTDDVAEFALTKLRPGPMDAGPVTPVTRIPPETGISVELNAAGDG